MLQLRWEVGLTGDDRVREVTRRRMLHYLALQRDWTTCRWCMEEVPRDEWASGRACGHQYHQVRE